MVFKFISIPNIMKKQFTTLLSAFVLLVVLPNTLVMATNQLEPCPKSPNCVSSDSQSKRHAIAALTPTATMNQTWRDIANYMTQTKGFKLVEHTDTVIKAEYKSGVFGFVDDVTFKKRGNSIAIRSASRTGYYDFGANRKRMETIREYLGKAAAK